MLGKTFKGMTDELLEWQTAALLEREVGREGHIVFVRPELVVEIAFNDVQESPQYPGGLALRFARVKSYRPDKTAAQADTLQSLQDIYRATTGREGALTARHRCLSCRTSSSTFPHSARASFGRTIEQVRLATPFLLRSVEPPLNAAVGRSVTGLRRIGKRIVWEMEGELFLVFHLMIAGRFKYRDRGAPIPRKVGLAAFDFADFTFLLTEAATQKRASLHVVQGEPDLRGVRSRWPGDRTGWRRCVCSCASKGESYAQAGFDRSAPVQRRRQRVFR